MNQTKTWIQAARLRTLPLGLSCVLVGGACAYSANSFEALTFILCILTAIGLQILSNFANDLGDAVKGSDENRNGETRTVASGLIQQSQMRRAILVTSALVFLIGSILIFRAFQDIFLIIGFYLIGGLSIWSAINYTMGENAYGYKALGDVFVFLFFGLVGTLGTYYSMAHSFPLDLFLPASGTGLLAVSVLHLNNMRDREEDLKHNKRTIAGYLGHERSKIYFALLSLIPFALFGTYALQHGFENPQYIFLVPLPIIAKNIRSVLKNSDPSQLDGLLKVNALSSFVLALLFLVGNIWLG